MTTRYSSPTLASIRTGSSALALALGVAACNKVPLHDLGYTSGDLSPPPDADVEDPEDPLPPVAQFASDFFGVWIGEADDPLALQANADVSPPPFQFPSGSTRIRLELSPLGPGEPNASGKLTFGDPMPAPTPRFDGTGDTSVRPAVEGFDYSVYSTVSFRELAAAGVDDDELSDFFGEGRVLDGKLELSYMPTEVFGAWCAEQTAETYYGDSAATSCQSSTCEGDECQCYGDTCTHSINRVSQMVLRFSVDGLVGLFSNAVFVNERGFQQLLGTLRFRRETP